MIQPITRRLVCVGVWGIALLRSANGYHTAANALCHRFRPDRDPAMNKGDGRMRRGFAKDRISR